VLSMSRTYLLRTRTRSAIRTHPVVTCWLTALMLTPHMQVATAIRGAIILAKTSIVPVRRGYWGNKIGSVHTVPAKTTGKCGSVTVRLIPAPRGAGIVAARTPKKVLQMAGIEDCYTASRGSTKTLGNFVKVSRRSLEPPHHSAASACVCAADSRTALCRQSPPWIGVSACVTVDRWTLC